MERLTFLHTCDFHLEEAHPERLEVLRWTLSAAEERGAAVLICGDLFDSAPQAIALRPAVREIFNSYPGVEVFVLPGNHDAESYSGGEDYGGSVRVLSSVPLQTLSYGGITLVAAPFDSGSRLAAALAGIPSIEGPSILMAHGTYFGQAYSFIRQEAQERGAEYYPIYPQDLQDAPFSYVALGHFHSRFNLIEEGGVTLCYPGSPVPVTRAETGIRHAALVSVEPGSGAVSVEPLPIGEGNYYISEEFGLLPGLEENAFSRLSTFLTENRSERAEVTIRLTGITQLSDEEINNKIEGLRRTHSPHCAGLEIVNGTQSYKGLMQNALVREFVARLEADENLNDDVRRLAVALGLRAFDRALARRR